MDEEKIKEILEENAKLKEALYLVRVISVQRRAIRHYNLVDLFFAVKNGVLNLQGCNSYHKNASTFADIRRVLTIYLYFIWVSVHIFV